MTTKQSASTLSLASIVSLHHAGDVSVGRAWLLNYAPSRYFSLPLQACHELIQSPKIIAAPGMARYAVGLLSWRGQWLPLLDMYSLITGHPIQTAQHMPHYLIVAYRGERGKVAYASLALSEFPQVVEVTDDSICALPRTPGFDWHRIASSCFRHLDSRVPIVDGEKLFLQMHP